MGNVYDLYASGCLVINLWVHTLVNEDGAMRIDSLIMIHEDND